MWTKVLETVHVQWMLANVDGVHIIPDGIIERLLEASVRDELRGGAKDYRILNI